LGQAMEKARCYRGQVHILHKMNSIELNIVWRKSE
jgi:hypothetical protein